MRLFLVLAVAVGALMFPILSSARAAVLSGPVAGSAQDIFTLAMGTWDRARGDSTCMGNTHEISFSDDRQQMVLTFEEPIDTTGQRVYRYEIRGVGPEVLPPLTHVIRAFMIGETRKTDAGELVVWDFVLATRNRYHWHRTDWPSLGITGAVVRCEGGRPLERWGPPPGAPTV
jgi:hypothetical protein